MGELTPKLLGDVPPDYAGNVSPKEAWRALERDPDAVLVDVRTAAEWAFVGGPDLSGLNKQIVAVEWQMFPAMNRNEAFWETVISRIGQNRDSSLGAFLGALFFLCRSGGRSAAAARLATQNGATQAYNIAGGFEGDLNRQGHRGNDNGWKADNLAWVQQ